MGGCVIVFDPTAFRVLFPAFADPTAFPDATLEMWFAWATEFITPYDSGSFMVTGAARSGALNLLTAHIGALAQIIMAGQTPGFETDAQIDKIRVAVQPPPAKTQFQWWLNGTPYGAQLAALLEMSAVGGFSVGGLPERSGIRRVGGGFNGPLFFRGGR